MVCGRRLNMRSSKLQLRNKLLEERLHSSNEFVESASLEITNKVNRPELWDNAHKVHIYLPMVGKNEVDTNLLLGWLFENNIEVWASYLSDNESEDGFCKITKDTKYRVGRYGIPLPSGEVAKTIQPDVIIVPCVAADYRGNRLGYGSGWYDKFLLKNPHAIKIGLVYEQFLFEEIPHEPHDQKLDIVVSEKQIIHTNNL